MVSCLLSTRAWTNFSYSVFTVSVTVEALPLASDITCKVSTFLNFDFPNTILACLGSSSSMFLFCCQSLVPPPIHIPFLSQLLWVSSFATLVSCYTCSFFPSRGWFHFSIRWLKDGVLKTCQIFFVYVSAAFDGTQCTSSVNNPKSAFLKFRVCALQLSFFSLLRTSNSTVSWLLQPLVTTSTTSSSLFVNNRSNCVAALIGPSSTCILDNLLIFRNLMQKFSWPCCLARRCQGG